MKIIENYDNALQAIYDHVGFEEDWVVYPIDNRTSKFWDTDGKSVFYADTEEEFHSEDGNYYLDEVYIQRFYKKWVYEGKDFTMIFCTQHVDGMIWFALFDNSKRLKKENED